MKLDDAYDLVTGKKRIEDIEGVTTGEVLQLLMGACLTDEDDIVCLKCSLLNECCTCD